jgi:hypothetical protein
MPFISLSFLGVYDCVLPIAKVAGVKVYPRQIYIYSRYFAYCYVADTTKIIY